MFVGSKLTNQNNPLTSYHIGKEYDEILYFKYIYIYLLIYLLDCEFKVERYPKYFKQISCPEEKELKRDWLICLLISLNLG